MFYDIEYYLIVFCVILAFAIVFVIISSINKRNK